MRATEQMKRELAVDGAIVVRNLLTPMQVQSVRRSIDLGVRNPSPRATHGVGDDGYELINDHHNPLNAERCLALINELALGRFVASLSNSEHAWFLGEELFVKSGGQNQRSRAASITNWHQDTSYLAANGPHLVNISISCEEVPRENALEIVRGSHLGVQYAIPSYDRPPDAPITPHGGAAFPPLPDVEADKAKDPGSWDIMSWHLQAGDALVFHAGTLHGGAPVTPACPMRHTLLLRFFGDKLYYRPLPSAHLGGPRNSPHVAPGISNNPSLRPGDIFRSPHFVQVY